MTEQELKDKVESFVDGFDGLIDRNLVKSWLVHFAKTYAEAETKELEEDYAELKMIHDKFYESDAVQHKQILALNAEIKRLREVAQRARQYCESGNGCGGATKLPSGEWFDEGEGTLYHAVLSVLSPAPVTEWKFPELIQSDVLPPNHFMGMGDDGKPFIGEISIGNLRPVTEKDKNVLPTDDEIHFVAVDESNADRHGWISLNQKPAYVDGFEDGAKWMRNKKTT